MTMVVISAAVTMVVAINPRESFCGGIMNFLGSNGTYDDEHARKMMMMMMIRKSSAYLPYLGTYVIMKSLLPPKKELRNMMCTHSLTHSLQLPSSREIIRNSRTLR